MPAVHTATQRNPRARSPRRAHPRTHQRFEEVPTDPCPSGVSPALHASVLVLNRLYLAVHVVNVRRAFCLLLRELAEVIDMDAGQFANHTFQSWQTLSSLRADSKQPHEDWIRAVSFEIQVPRVIRLLAYDRIPRQTLHLNRHTVLARDGHRCQYCGQRFPSHQLSVDHVTPRSRGGTTTWENVVCACVRCNTKKGGRTPREAKMTLVRRPATPRQNPVLVLKLENPKYESWKTWIEGVYWDLGSGVY